MKQHIKSLMFQLVCNILIYKKMNVFFSTIKWMSLNHYVFVFQTGSLGASCQLISDLGCNVIECVVVFEITDLKGRERIAAPVHSILQYSEN